MVHLYSVTVLVEIDVLTTGLSDHYFLNDFWSNKYAQHNQKTESFMYRWLPMFDLTCFPVFVRARDIISSVDMYIV